MRERLTLLDPGVPVRNPRDDDTVDYSFEPRFTSSALPGWFIEVRARVIAGRLIITAITLDSGSNEADVRTQRDAMCGADERWWPGHGALTNAVLKKVSVPAMLATLHGLLAGAGGIDDLTSPQTSAWRALQRERWTDHGSAIAAAAATATPHTTRSGGRPKTRSEADHERTAETLLRLQAEHRDYRKRAAAELGRNPESLRHDIADCEKAGYLVPGGTKNHRQPGPALLRRRKERGAG